MANNNKQTSVLKLSIKIWKHLKPKRKYQLAFIFILMLLSGVSEILSLASIIPFLGILTSPEKIWQIDFIRNIAISLGTNSPSELLLPSTIIFSLTSIFSGIVRIYNYKANFNLSSAIGSDISSDCFKKIIYQPYIIQVQQNSSRAISISTTKIDHVVASISFLLQILSTIVLSVSILFGLILINRNIAILLLSIVGFSYLIIAFFSRKYLLKNSKFVARAITEQVKIIQEVLGGIREIILDNSFHQSINSYKDVEIPRRQKAAQSNFLGVLPKYTIETIGLVTLVLVSYFLASNDNEASLIIPTIGSIALGSQRLLPSFQQLYASWAGINTYIASVEDVLIVLDQKVNTFPSVSKSTNECLKRTIKLKNINFKYNAKGPLILDSVNLSIKKGDRIGLVGTTGSGKSTLMDIFMGLLKPTEGVFEIDGEDLYKGGDVNKKLQKWRSTISHVPQLIFLPDKTIAENIAFNIPKDEIDINKVVKSAKVAMIHSTIESLAQGYNSRIGERGIQLSGGQIQRIGIARSIYKQTPILVFDEATSALDESTEKEVIKLINNLGREITIIMVAHRKRTLDNCNKIVRLENGKIDSIIERNFI